MINPLPKVHAKHTAIYLFLACLLLGCNSGDADKLTDESKSAQKDLEMAQHKQYYASVGEPHDCLGRLVFATPREHEWALRGYHPEIDDYNNSAQFGRSMILNGGGGINVGNFGIQIQQYAQKKDLDVRIRGEEADVKRALSEYRRGIKADKNIKKKLEAILADPSLNLGGDNLSGYPASIKRTQKRIDDAQAAILDVQQNNEEIDLGIPDSRGYRSGGVYTAYIYHDGYIFDLEFHGMPGQFKTQAERKAAFFEQLRRFRPRQLNEIPTEPGICIPHGFFADDGSSRFNVNASMRFKDQLGVMYRIGTGIVADDYIRLPNPSFIKASIGSMAAGRYGGEVKERIGPRTAYIGAIPASQGGAVVAAPSEGNPDSEIYSVYTAFDGKEGSHVLPFITVNMRNYLMTQESSLKNDPPPYAETKPRLEHLLNSIRLRPTNEENTSLTVAKTKGRSNESLVNEVIAQRDARRAAKYAAEEKEANKIIYLTKPHPLCKFKEPEIRLQININTVWTISTNVVPRGMGVIRPDDLIARGRADENGLIALSIAENKRIHDTLCKENKEVWVSYPGQSKKFSDYYQ